MAQNRNGNQQLSTQGRVNDLRKYLYAGKAQLALALDRHMDPDRVIRLALTAATKVPALLNCTPESVALSLMTAGQLGLEVNGRDAHLVPFGNQCQLIPDYKGLVKLAFQSGLVKRFTARPVYENDLYEFELGTNEYLRHKPADGDRGGLRAAYAIVQLRDCEPEFFAYTKADVLKRKAASKSSHKPDSPWQKWEAEMWAKTAVKMTVPFVPLGGSFELAVAHDNAVEAGEPSPAAEGLRPLPSPQSSTTATQRLSADMLGEQSQEPPPVDDGRNVAAELEAMVLGCETDADLDTANDEIAAALQAGQVDSAIAEHLTRKLNARAKALAN